MSNAIILNSKNVIGNSNSQFQYNFLNGSFEGIGTMYWHMSYGFFLARYFDLKYIINPEWYISEHDTHYFDLFGFEIDTDCSADDVLHNKHHLSVVKIQMNGISSCDPGIGLKSSDDICSRMEADRHYTYRNISYEDGLQLKSEHGALHQIYKHMHKRNKRTVFDVHINYGCLHYFCRNIIREYFQNAYLKQKSYDASLGKHRFLAQKGINIGNFTLYPVVFLYCTRLIVAYISFSHPMG